MILYIFSLGRNANRAYEIICFYFNITTGKMYVLLFKSVTPEDVGEVKFTAEKASSSAKLKVKGKTGTLCVVDVCQQ